MGNRANLIAKSLEENRFPLLNFLSSEGFLCLICAKLLIGAGKGQISISGTICGSSKINLGYFMVFKCDSKCI